MQSDLPLSDLRKINSDTTLRMLRAMMMPVRSYLHAVYFTLRSGGEAIATFIFDSGYVWACMIPVAFLLSRFTNLPIIPLYFICQSLDALKILIGRHMLKKGKWIQNLTT